MSELLQELGAADLVDPFAVVDSTPPVTLSADIRNSGYKIAPIDLNLFPAGWHNLCSGALPGAGRSILKWAQTQSLACEHVLVLAEFMTRNAPYIENLLAIGRALEAAGIEVAYGTLDPELEQDEVSLEAMRGDLLTMQRLQRVGDALHTASGFEPDWILCNNDFTSGVPDVLDAIVTPISPSPLFGWHNRKKSDFFKAYERVATQVAEQAGIDPWQIVPDTVAIDDVDFWNQEGIEPVADAVDAMLERIASAYRERGIEDTPFVVVKDEAGTFGMGVVTLESGDPIRNPNRKIRQKMQRGKSGRPITGVLVQEGIYTRDLIRECVAEPVVMAAGGEMLGGFFRYHCSRDETENLNTKGMVFARLCSSNMSGGDCPEDCIRDDLRYGVYGWFARLAAVAAGQELARGLDAT